MVCHVASSGDPGFVLANGSLSLGQSNEGEIRRNLLEADLMDCMVALPGQLFLAYLEHLFEPRDPSFPLIGIDIDMTPGECPRLGTRIVGLPLGIAWGNPGTQMFAQPQTHLMTESERGGNLRTRAFTCSILRMRR